LEDRARALEAVEINSQSTQMNAVESSICLNCRTVLKGKYCHECGQKLIKDRLTVRAVFMDVVAQITKWDSSLIRTIVTLFRHPSEVAFAYLVGQRQLYVAPVRYMIVALAVEFASTPLLKWIADQIGNVGAQVWLEQSGISYSLRFLQVFVLSTIWRFLFRNIGYNIAEMYAFGFYVFSQIIMINVIINMLAVAFPIPEISHELSIALLSVVDFVFLALAAQNFFARTWPTTITRLLLSYIAPLALLWVWIKYID